MFFVSYARTEKPLMLVNIRDTLQQISAPHWYDEHISETITDDKWWDEIVRQIESAHYFTFLFTEAWQQSTICRRELATAEQFKKKLIPVQIDHFHLLPALGYLQEQFQIAKIFEQNGRTTLRARYVNAKKRAESDIKKSPNGDNPAFGLEHYCARVAETNRKIRILGRGDPLNLSEIFLRIGLSQHGRHGEEYFQVDDLLGNKIGNKILLSGGPGSGKSTILQYLQLESADNKCVYFPIATKFRTLVSLQDPLEKWAEDHLRGQIGEGLDFFSLPRSAAEPKLMLQLDGLDEVPDTEAERLTKEILRFSNQYPSVRLVITSRPSGFRTSDFSEFDRFDIQPLREPEMRGYVVKVVPSEHVERVWNVINSHPRIFDLATTPFLLALICSAFNELGRGAYQRATLFRSCIRFLLRSDDWEAKRERTSKRDAEDMLKILKFIAVRFFKLDYVDNFSEVEIIQNISLIPGYQSEATNVLRKIVDKTGLLQFDRDGYQFVHRCVWEYLVAEGCRDEPLDVLVDKASSRLWEEPIKMFVGLTPTSELRKVLTAIWERNPSLALRAMTETQTFPQSLLDSLYTTASSADKIKILQELRSSVVSAATEKEANRILVDTVGAIIHTETDCEILFSLIGFLRQSGSDEARDLVSRILDQSAIATRLRKYSSNDEFFLDFSYVPAGKFAMGTDHLPDGRPVDASEKPAHPVQLSEFWISRYLITNVLFYDTFPYATDRRNE